MAEPFNHGKPWTQDHYRLLADYFNAGATVGEIAVELGRKVDSVFGKLQARGLIRLDYGAGAVLTEAGDRVCSIQDAADPALAHGIRHPCPSRPRYYLTGGAEALAAECRELLKSHIAQGEVEMSQKLIETKTFILGIEASAASDDDIFKAIAGAEAQVKRWEAIECRPKRLQARIDNTKKEIAELVAFLDAADAT